MLHSLRKSKTGCRTFIAQILTKVQFFLQIMTFQFKLFTEIFTDPAHEVRIRTLLMYDNETLVFYELSRHHGDVYDASGRTAGLRSVVYSPDFHRSPRVREAA
jgi:hypothetical protein